MRSRAGSSRRPKRSLGCSKRRTAGVEFLMECDLFAPSFARRSGLREGGKPVSAFPDHARLRRRTLLEIVKDLGCLQPEHLMGQAAVLIEPGLNVVRIGFQ